MSDFNLKVTVRNAHLLRAIRDKCGSNAELARQSGVRASVVAAFVTMRISPFLRDGSLNMHAQQVCDFLGKNPEDLWPGRMAEMRRRKATHEVEVSMDEAASICGGGNQVEARMMIEGWAGGLRPKEATIIDMRMNGATLEECGSALGGLSRERVRQLEAKGLRKMRAAALRQGFREFTDVME